MVNKGKNPNANSGANTTPKGATPANNQNMVQPQQYMVMPMQNTQQGRPFVQQNNGAQHFNQAQGQYTSQQPVAPQPQQYYQQPYYNGQPQYIAQQPVAPQPQAQMQQYTNHGYYGQPQYTSQQPVAPQPQQYYQQPYYNGQPQYIAQQPVAPQPQAQMQQPNTAFNKLQPFPGFDPSKGVSTFPHTPENEAMMENYIQKAISAGNAFIAPSEPEEEQIANFEKLGSLQPSQLQQIDETLSRVATGVRDEQFFKLMLDIRNAGANEDDINAYRSIYENNGYKVNGLSTNPQDYVGLSKEYYQEMQGEGQMDEDMEEDEDLPSDDVNDENKVTTNNSNTEEDEKIEEKGDDVAFLSDIVMMS